MFRDDKEKDDKEIVDFIRQVQNSQNIADWKEFDHPLTESGNASLVSFRINDLAKKYSLDFLDRIQITHAENNVVFYATVIGEYQHKLYIHVDKLGCAQPLINYNVYQDFQVTKTDSFKTQFKSALEFLHLYLGRYLLIHNKFEEKKLFDNSRKTHGFLFFDAKVERSQAYLEIAKLHLNMCDSLRRK